MATIQVNGLQVLAVYVSDLALAKGFYCGELGFQQTEEMSPGILLKAGEVTLYLEGGRFAKDHVLKAAEFCPCFATESVKASYEALKKREIRIVSDYQEFAPTFAFFKIADPDGNVIEFAGKP